MFETIRIDTDPRGVATLTLARAEKHNSLSATMIAELTAAAEQLGADPAVRVVILTGEGASFCAGGDLDWMRAQFTADRATRIAEARKLAVMLQALNELPKPLIGRVQGQAFGGGIGMMSVCDVCIAVDGAKFGLTETRLGLIPATISPYVVARMGEGKARRVFMSARLFDAAEARDLDLVARVVAAEELGVAVEREVKPYLAAAPGAVARAKALARSLGTPITEAVIAATIERLADCWEDPEAHEGISAFFDKRKPAWS
ncbi:crotonase/enoyl-CoA hydratase family protein [Microvirga tunisiensis]|uniref:Crotonase/enoyl-CoA hydratase family protein n=1 Tax=Pannonibacter tanglangensis TaxID=2750084 RepID=A0A7X5F659_9HYPH|nr:crotonase/enoyl-CoA hydratase family protein [Pannonibacter sp. XCT-53]NBN80435.1 crotonase/enoyl-CoA hydratase family protein [Pannonibacter sp. XCT-53]